MLKIYLFGHIRLQHDQSTFESKITPTVQALLAYLLIQPRRTYARDALMELGWGDRPQDQARSCLNTALWRLRNVLEPEGVRRGSYLLSGQNGDVGFNWDSDFWMDAAVFESTAQSILAAHWQSIDDQQAAQLEQSLQLYQGDLLEGFYYDWVLEERERKRALYLNCLRTIQYYYQHHERYDLAISIGQKILRLDPLREEVHRDLMAIYMKNGQRALALQQYEVCHTCLQNELGIAPMPETRALYEQILAESREKYILDQALDENMSTTRKLALQQAVEQLNRILADLDTTRQEIKRTLALLNRLNIEK
jgi:DNA-binding SARP family transcriptional activator